MKKRLQRSQLIIPLLILMIASVQSYYFVIKMKAIEENFEEDSLLGQEIINGNQAASTVLQTMDGGFVLAGWTDSEGAGGIDMWLVKTDSNGITQWNQTYGGTGNDIVMDLLQTTDGGYVLAGRTNSFGTGEYDMWLVKTDNNGFTEWNQTYGGAGYEAAYALLQTTDGGFALVGETGDIQNQCLDVWLVKTDAEGNIHWNQTYTRPAWSSAAYSLVQTPDSGYALAGARAQCPLIPYLPFIWLVRTDPSGNLVWNQTYQGDSVAVALIQTPDGGFIMAGDTGLNSYYNMWLGKTYANGTLQWNHTYGGPDDDGPWALIQAIDGGYALAGSTRSYGVGDWDMWLVKTDVEGKIEWNQTFGGIKEDYAMGLLQTSDGMYVLAGYTNSYGEDWDMLLVKINDLGTIQWEHHYGGTLNIPPHQTTTTTSRTEISSLATDSEEKNNTFTTSHQSESLFDLLQILPFVGVSGVLAFVITLVIVVRRYQRE